MRKENRIQELKTGATEWLEAMTMTNQARHDVGSVADALGQAGVIGHRLDSRWFNFGAGQASLLENGVAGVVKD